MHNLKCQIAESTVRWIIGNYIIEQRDDKYPKGVI